MPGPRGGEVFAPGGVCSQGGVPGPGGGGCAWSGGGVCSRGGGGYPSMH